MLGAFIGVSLALLLYDLLIVQPRESRRAQGATVDLTHTAVEAKRIADSVDSSVKQTIDDARDAFEAQAADQAKRRMVAEALARTQMYKVALAESFVSNGRWPVKASEAGLPQDDRKAGGAIRGITVGERGVVTVTFDRRFAEGARLHLVPQADPDTFEVRWQCQVSGDPDLKRYLPECSSG